MMIQPTDIDGVFEFRTRPVADDRGWFGRIFCAAELAAAGIPTFTLVQANISHNERRGAFRGLHFQVPPHAECKIVRCIRGEILDLVVDLRAQSPTFLRHLAVELSAAAKNALYVPRGVAHGFQVLSPGADVLYLHDTPYDAGASRVIHVASPALGIELPLEIGDISAKDATAERIDASYAGLRP
jgi:dTDP-4-dehydrorhamnose 3,5-epimerase